MRERRSKLASLFSKRWFFIIFLTKFLLFGSHAMIHILGASWGQQPSPTSGQTSPQEKPKSPTELVEESKDEGDFKPPTKTSPEYPGFAPGKAEVLEKIADVLEKKSMFVLLNPELDDIKKIATKWRDIWRTTKYDNDTIGDASIATLKEMAKTGGRRTFAMAVNRILNSMTSELNLIPLKEFLLNKQQTLLGRILGYSFEKKEGQPYEEYKITKVVSDGIARKKGLRVGDVFYIPNKEEDAQKQGGSLGIVSAVTKDRTVTSVMDVLFYRDKAFVFRLAHRFPEKELASNLKVKDYSSSDYREYRKTAIEAQSNPGEYPGGLYPLTIKTFGSDESPYPGGIVEDAMKYAIENNLKLLVIDLRDNGEGSVDNAAHLLSWFLPAKTPYSIIVDRATWNEFKKSRPYTDLLEEYRKTGVFPQKDLFERLARFMGLTTTQATINRIPEGYRRLRPTLYQGRVAILINKNTSSYSEEIAAVLRSILGKDRCVIIGEKSTGAVLPSVTGDPDTILQGYLIQYPVRDIIFPNGERVEGVGIKPDIVIKGDRPLRDYLQAALQWNAQKEAEQKATGKAAEKPKG